MNRSCMADFVSSPTQIRALIQARADLQQLISQGPRASAADFEKSATKSILEMGRFKRSKEFLNNL